MVVQNLGHLTLSHADPTINVREDEERRPSAIANTIGSIGSPWLGEQDIALLTPRVQSADRDFGESSAQVNVKTLSGVHA